MSGVLFVYWEGFYLPPLPVLGAVAMLAGGLVAGRLNKETDPRRGLPHPMLKVRTGVPCCVSRQ